MSLLFFLLFFFFFLVLALTVIYVFVFVAWRWKFSASCESICFFRISNMLLVEISNEILMNLMRDSEASQIFKGILLSHKMYMYKYRKGCRLGQKSYAF